MSALTIKNAIKQLLTENVPSLKYVESQYERITQNSDSPRAVVWDLSFREVRAAVGASSYPQGLKSRIWQMGTHVVAFYTDPLTGGDEFDTLLDAIETLYRSKPTLDGLGDNPTPYSRVTKFAEEMTRDKPPPDMRQGQYVRFDAIIVCEVEEFMNA